MMRKVFVIASFLSLPLLAAACGPFGPGPGRGWEPGQMMNYGFCYGGAFMWVIFLFVLVVAVYFIVQALKSKNSAPEARETPLDILKKRYAKGEITKEEFDRMKKDLG